MKLFEVRKQGLTIASTEDVQEALSKARSLKADSVVSVNADAGSFTDCKVIWSR